MPNTKPIVVAIFKCPEEDCGIYNRLIYSADTYGREWGTITPYFIDNTVHLDLSCDDSESSDSDNYMYQCARCDMEYTKEDIRGATKKITLPPGTAIPREQIEYGEWYNRKPGTKGNPTKIQRPIHGSNVIISLLKSENIELNQNGNECMHCGHMYTNNNEKELSACPHCGTEPEI